MAKTTEQQGLFELNAGRDGLQSRHRAGVFSAVRGFYERKKSSRGQVKRKKTFFDAETGTTG